MKTNVFRVVGIAALTLVLARGPAWAESEPVVGMLTPFTTGGQPTYVAYPVDASFGTTVNAISWHNNDGTAAWTSITVVPAKNGVPDLSTVLYSASSVMGSSDAPMQQLCDPAPVSAGTGLFVVFEYPEALRTHRGLGGGPGIGVHAAAETDDGTLIGIGGEDWIGLPDGVDLAISVFVTEGGLSRSVIRTGDQGGDSNVAGMRYRTGLESVFPNPANPMLQVRFALEAAGEATVRVYNARGQLVRTLVDDWLPVGQHHVRWTGVDDAGHGVSSGVYFVRFKSGRHTSQDRVTLVR